MSTGEWQGRHTDDGAREQSGAEKLGHVVAHHRSRHFGDCGDPIRTLANQDPGGFAPADPLRLRSRGTL
jgi:hypothetical protein